MKRVLLVTLLNVLYHSTHVCVLGSVVTKYITYDLYPSTWQAARENCRYLLRSGDLALLTQQSDNDLLNPYLYLSWIGLYKDGSKWKWSDGSAHLYNSYEWTYVKDQWGDCAVIDSKKKKFQRESCDDKLFFYCSDVDMTITFVMLAKTWVNAQTYCQNNHNDLVTLKWMGDFSDLPAHNLFYIWTGLHRAKPDGDWTSSIGKATNYENWAEGKPTEDGDCVGISNTDKKMTNFDCKSLFPFYCLQDNLVLVKEKKTWEEALEHCRTMDLADPSLLHFNQPRNDLISISDQSDQHIVWSRINEATTNEVVLLHISNMKK
ncbi:unnamed protein product [Lota lota]